MARVKVKKLDSKFSAQPIACREGIIFNPKSDHAVKRFFPDNQGNILY